jgi:PEP-CTERM motif
MPKRAHIAIIGLVLFASSAAFGTSISFTVTADFKTLAGQDEVIFGYAPLVNNTSTNLSTVDLDVDFITGQGIFDQIDLAHDGMYGFSYPTIYANNSLNTAGFLGLYIAPPGFKGPVTLTFLISTVGPGNTIGPYYTATYSFNFPATIPEPGTWALLGSGQIATGLMWFKVRRKRKETFSRSRV